MMLEVTPKLALKLPKLNLVLSDSGTWMWFGNITCWLGRICKSPSFVCNAVVASSKFRTLDAGCDCALASTGMVETSDVPADPDA